MHDYPHTHALDDCTRSKMFLREDKAANSTSDCGLLRFSAGCPRLISDITWWNPNEYCLNPQISQVTVYNMIVVVLILLLVVAVGIVVVACGLLLLPLIVRYCPGVSASNSYY